MSYRINFKKDPSKSTGPRPVCPHCKKPGLGIPMRTLEHNGIVRQCRFCKGVEAA